MKLWPQHRTNEQMSSTHKNSNVVPERRVLVEVDQFLRVELLEGFFWHQLEAVDVKLGTLLGI